MDNNDFDPSFSDDFDDEGDLGGLFLKKTIKIVLHDNGRYSVNANGFPLTETGMMEALWILKDSQDTLREAFENKINEGAQKKRRGRKSRTIEAEMDARVFENLSEEDIAWLKKKFGEDNA